MKLMFCFVFPVKLMTYFLFGNKLDCDQIVCSEIIVDA